MTGRLMLKQTFLERLDYIFVHPFRWRIKEFLRGLYNFWYFRKVIWHNREWDYYHIYEYLSLKFKKMYEYRTKSESMLKYVGDEKVNKVILECYVLSNRLKEDNFASYWHGKIPDRSILDVLEQNWSSEEYKQKWYKAVRRAYKKELNIREWHRARLFTLLDKHLHSMWD